MKRFNVLIVTAAVIALAAACGHGKIEANAETSAVIYAPGVKQSAETKESSAAPFEIEIAKDGSAQMVEISEAPGAAQTESQAAVAETAAAVSAAETTAAQTESETTAAQTEAQTTAAETTAAETAAASGEAVTKNGYKNGDHIGLNSAWKYADYSKVNSGAAVMYTASSNRKNRIIAVNAGHGTKGGESVRTFCHPDQTPKVTGGSTAAGSTTATSVSYGMSFNDGTPEHKVTLRMAQILKEKLLAAGYDVLMIRDGEDVQLDNIARTVISNNTADCHIALHWDGDGLSYDKGVYYMSVPDKLKQMEPVTSHWQMHEALGDALISGISSKGIKVWGSNPLDMDLTQTSYSTIPSVDIELGNQCSDHSDSRLDLEAEGLVAGINIFFGF